jgi:hypothetical protein
MYLLVQTTSIRQPALDERPTRLIVETIGGQIVTYPAVYDPRFLDALARGFGGEGEEDGGVG